MYIIEETKKILDKYPNINYKKYLYAQFGTEEFDDFLLDLNSEMVSYGDAQDEPLEEWLELERVYDEIFYDNEKLQTLS